MDRDALTGCLCLLSAYADERGRIEAAALLDRLDAGLVRVLLVGEAKRGKSTLGNALLRRDLLPSGVRPVTALATSIASGSPERICVRHHDGTTTETDLGELALYVTEQHNPGNRRQVDSVEGFVEAMPWAGAVLVDTPGVGSVLAHNTSEAERAMNAMDVALFVLTADPPISESERRLLDVVRASSVSIFIVLNKADRLTPEELTEARSYVTEVTGAVEIHICSARDALVALQASDDLALARSGVESLRSAVGHRLAAHAESDLVDSIRRAAQRTAISAMARLNVSSASLEAMLAGRGRDVQLFLEELREGQSRAAQAKAAASWEQQAIRTRLDDEAATLTQDLTRRLLTQVDEWVTQEPTPQQASEEVSTARLVDLIERDVAQWRREWLVALDRSINAVAARQQRALDDAAEAVASASLRLLGTEIRPVIREVDPPDLGGFSFDFTPEVGWNTVMVERARRLLRGKARRRSLARRLRSQTVTLVDKQVGRARSDLQRRLEAALRDLTREVSARFEEQQAGLSEAAAEAKRVAEESLSGAEGRLRVLAEQLATLRTTSHRLGALAPLETRHSHE